MPKKTIATIAESGNHYVVQVKGNQPRLYKAIQENILEYAPIEVYEHKEKLRGKWCYWSIHLYRAHLGDVQKEWAGVKRIIQVAKRVYSKKKETNNQRHYISDLAPVDASTFHEAIRGHWGIENRLHWVKDVVHKEDRNRIRTANGPINMSIMSTMTINIHRKTGATSITDRQIKCGCNLEWTLGLLRT